MSDMDFFVDLVTTGTVLGLDHTSDLAVVEEVLGHNQTYEAPYGMITDIGLVEFGWDRSDLTQAWSVTYFGAQAHRLKFLNGEAGTPLVDHYGRFRSRLDIGELDAAVRDRGFVLEEIPYDNKGYTEYWEPTSRMSVLVYTDPEAAGDDEVIGTVVKILGPLGANNWSWSPRLRLGEYEQKFTSYAQHIRALSDGDLQDWLDRREPGTEPDRSDWWGRLRIALRRRSWPHQKEWRIWARLGVILDCYAVQRGVGPADEAAIRLALAVAEAHDLGVADEVPAMDDAIERWLAAAPISLADARRLCDERPLDPAGIRISRRLRNHLHDLQQCLPLVASAAIADNLREWVNLKPDLLGLSAYR